MALLGACRSSSPADPCVAACARLTQAGCGRAGLGPEDHERCVVGCRGQEQTARKASCETEWLSAMRCTAARGLSCESAHCSASVCLETGQGVTGCSRQYARLVACRAPCENAGSTELVSRSVKGRAVRAEVTRAGCQGCGTLVAGAPPGAPCQSASVCAEQCCACPRSKSAFKTRLCVDGSCVKSACELARTAATDDPCQLR
ncbi:MAG: hypothetical protein H6717_05305 [Polyangiaceae bacterium]|nr:hypothetical protein [Polyangiaceae bacterium]